MKAIEFETTVKHHILQIPEDIPDGMKIRVLVLYDEQKNLQLPERDVKTLLASVSEGLEDTDLIRQNDLCREVSTWLT